MAIVGLLTFIPSFLSICATMPRQPRLSKCTQRGQRESVSGIIGEGETALFVVIVERNYGRRQDEASTFFMRYAHFFSE